MEDLQGQAFPLQEVEGGLLVEELEERAFPRRGLGQAVVGKRWRHGRRDCVANIVGGRQQSAAPEGIAAKPRTSKFV